MEESLAVAADPLDPLVAPPVPGARDLRDFTPYRQMPTPEGWTKLEKRLQSASNSIVIGSYVRDDTVKTHSRLVALATVELLDANDSTAGAWFHLTVTRAKHLPSWEDLRRTHDAFIGNGEPAIQVFAPSASWLNRFEHCLHLLVRIDQPTVPEALWRGHGHGPFGITEHAK